jgi:hypothetical protein
MISPYPAEVVMEGETAVSKWVVMKGQNPNIKVHEYGDANALVLF